MSIERLFEVAQGFLLILQAAIDAGETYRRNIRRIGSGCEIADFAKGLFPPIGHGVAVSELAAQERAALQLSRIGEVRDSVLEHALARISQSQAEMGKRIIRRELGNQKMLRNGLIPPAAYAVQPSEDEIGKQRRRIQFQGALDFDHRAIEYSTTSQLHAVSDVADRIVGIELDGLL